MEWSCGWNQKNQDPVSQQVWHDKDPSLLKGPESLAYRLKFCSPSSVMMTSPYKWKILERDVFDDLQRTRSHGYNLNLFCQKIQKKNNFGIVFKISMHWWHFMYERSYDDFAHPSELEIIDTTDRMFHICFIFKYSCEIGWSQQTKDSTIRQMGWLQFLFSTLLSVLFTCPGDRTHVGCDCSTRDAYSS